jgi:outer membrane protein assembly factor BamB
MDKARDKELQKQWKTAAEFYHDALSKYSARVVPVLRDADKGIYRYSGIAPIVQERTARWPVEGLTIFRNLYGQTAADLLSGAARGDNAALRRIFWDYFVTDAGKTAGIRLMDASMESGDFQAARWIGNRLLTLHPLLGADRAMIVYRTAIACQWAGDLPQAQLLAAQLKQQDPTAVGSIGGKDVQLVDALTTALAAAMPPPTTRPSDADTYPSYGGIGGRGEIPPSTARPGASLNSVTLTPPDWGVMMGNQKAQYQQSDQLTLNNYLAMGIMPVADAGALFFQDGRSLYAVDADSGAPLPGWLNTYGGERNGRYKVNVFGRASHEILTVAVSPAAVLAVMGQPDRGSALNPNGGNVVINAPGMGLAAGNAASTVKLVCLDRDSGRELWTKTPADLPESAAAIRNGEYNGTPLIVPAAEGGAAASGANASPEDSVLVIARGSKENQFDDCYVVCLGQKTGQYRWSTYVGSATRNIDMDGFVSQDSSILSLANGRVFVMTNLGSVVALDPADGRVIWLNSYNREGSDNPEAMMLQRRRFGNQGFASSSGDRKVWAHNPVCVSDGNVFVLPCDARQLFVYDAGTGEEKKRLPMSAWDNASVLLGVRAGLVCVTSDKGVFMLDWKNYQDGDPKSGTRWSEADVSRNDEHSYIYGRGFVTSDAIFIPTKNRLIQMTWKSGRTVAYYPARGKFTGDQGPGNLLVTGHNIVVAGQTRVDVYTDLLLVKEKYETAMAAAPNDPGPRVMYAEALFAGGQTQDALARVDEAINLTGGINSMRPGRDRSMIFNAMLEFARRADSNVQVETDKDKKSQAIAEANAFFDRAAAAAESPVENATYRLVRGGFDHQQADYAGEVKLCQEILSDQAMRDAALPDDTNAGTAAEAAIDMAINQERSSYAPVETLAAAALKDARDTHDANQLLAVATVYPNAKAAVEARQEAVHLFEAENQPDKAISVLRRMYASATDGATKAHLLESIANDFLVSSDGLGPAIDRLCRAARFTPDQKLSQPIRLWNGTTLTDITTTEAIGRLRQLQGEQDSAKLPDFHLLTPVWGHGPNPFSTRQPAVINDVLAIVHPLEDFSRKDQILTWSAAGLGVYVAGASTPIFTVADVNQPPISAAYDHGHWLVWTANQLYAINAEGKVEWTFGIDHLPTMLVSAGGEALVDDTGEPPTDEGMNQVRLIQVNGQLVRVPVQGGVIINGGRRIRVGGVMNPVVVPPQLPPAPPANLAQAPELIAAVRPSGPGGTQVLVSTSTGRVLALENRSGQLNWQTRMIDHGVDQLLANAHFTVLRMDDPGGSQLAVLDTPTGRLIGKRRFGPEGSPNQLINAALSEEATLAMTLFGRVVVKELYDPWKVAPIEPPAQSNRDQAPIGSLTQPDQLLVKAGQLVWLYDNGRYARGYDLSKSSDPTNPLQTEANTPAVSLRMVGSRVFILTSNQLREYNLADPTDHFEANPNVAEWIPARAWPHLLLGTDYAVVIYDPVDRGPAGSPWVKLACYRREQIKGSTRESYMVDYVPRIDSPAGIIDWQETDGGVYYLTKDNKLNMYRGARP